MASISFVAFGSRGDVQPMLALALEVKRRGHEVRLFTRPGLEDWLRPYAIPLLVAGRPARDILAAPGVYDVLTALRADLETCARAVHENMGETDTLVSTAVFPAAEALCERHRARHVYVGVGAHVIDSDRYPVSGLPFHHLPRAVNALTWRLNAVLWDAAFGGPLQRVRRELGLKKKYGAWEQHRGSDIIIAADPVFGTLPQIAERRVTFTGALTLADPRELPTSLVDFLSRGPPPVFFGFGSMPQEQTADGRSLSRIFLGAARRIGRRAVLLAGSESERVDGDDVYVTGPVDFDRLLARCAAIVHHAGAGTTHAALRAGIPQVTVPHLLDQFGWSEAILRASLGPAPLRPRGLSEEALAGALESALSSAHVTAAKRAASAALIGNAKAADVVLNLS